MKYLLIIFLYFVSQIVIGDSVSVETWKEEKKDFIYKRKKEDEKSEKPQKPDLKKSDTNISKGSPKLSWLKFFGHPAFLYSIIFIVILLILVLLLKNITIPQKIKNVELPEIDDNVEEKLMETDIDRLIRLALENRNYQLAIRYTFLKTLKGLVEQGKLNWKKQYTNKDYLTQLYQTSLYDSFRVIVLIYERKWYGENISTIEEFENYKSTCKQLNPLI